ncbi:hypothetical protein EAH75_16875 [Rhodanobacter glycinis]|uniref:abortive infection system antitoxin AbiGi family protein n=1 Tax=Rhodanobacter glycinis TaxID=582702 RepID=UPI00112EAE95|nr:abortive infection system antitoxin AbiGi family protein [Rhodanobacter glycinis]TPG46279.1 hypothetical protein EAH75_16875 [Rhodanobacter glycinis]
MPVSSNTLIHFTNDKERLKSIFLENFRVGYCKEAPTLGGFGTKCYVPMVSFCDIPLSQIKDHISKYGDYGIGLTREWGIRNKLNPVLYLEPNSLLSESYRAAANYFLARAREEKDVVAKSDDYFRAVIALGEMLSYTKNYQGQLVRRDGTTTNDYRFSDEREWRYVLPSQNGVTPIMSEEHFTSDAGQARSSEVADSVRLEFEPNDIRYVIIKDDSEIHEFVDHLRNAKRKKYSERDIDRLTTRILTTEQIRQDI